LNRIPPLPRYFIAWEYKEGRFWRLVDGLPHDEIVRQRGKKRKKTTIFMNPKLIKTLRLVATGLMIPLVLTLVVTEIEPMIEFPSVSFNRFWGFLICYLYLVSYIIFLLTFKSFKKISKWIILGIGIPITFFVIFSLLTQYEKIYYQPHFDRYVAYKNLEKSNEFIVVQDYMNWKLNKPAVDTVLVNDYYLLRRVEFIKKMNLKGTWIKLDEKGNELDTIRIK
jgi:hypothetical protein